MKQINFSREVKTVKFGCWNLSPKRQTIFDGKVERELEPLLYNLLAYLILNREKIVTRQELVDEVWQQVYVDDNAINRAMSRLRKICKSELQRGQILKTHYRKGYSFLLDVEIIKYDKKRTTNENIELINAEKDKYILVSKKNNKKDKQFEVKFKDKKSIQYFLFFVFLLSILTFIYYFNQDKDVNLKIVEVKNYSSDILSWKRGTYEFPYLSSSGKYLAYALKEENKPVSSLHIKDMKNLKDFIINENQYDVYPIGWSNQSNILFYQLISVGDDNLCEIWSVDLSIEPNLAKHNKLFECSSSYVLSASSYDNNKLIYTKYGYRGRLDTAALVMRDLMSNEEFQVSLPGFKPIGDYSLKISQNSERLAFLRSQSYGTQIFVTNIDGSNQSMIAEVDYIIRSVYWDDMSQHIMWFNKSDNILNKYDVLTKKLQHSVVKTTEDIHDLIFISEDDLLITTKWTDYDLVNLSLKTNEIINFSNMTLKEKLIAPLKEAQHALLLIEGERHAIWYVKGDNRSKVIELDFKDTVSIAVSPDETQLLVARNKYLYFYSLNNYELVNKVSIVGQIQSADWGRSDKKVIYTASSLELNKTYGWFYDIENKRSNQIYNSNLFDAKMISDTQLIYLDSKNQFVQLNLENNHTDIILDLSAEADIIWTHDDLNIYYTDNISIFKKVISSKKTAEEIFKVDKDMELIASLSSDKNSEANSLYISLIRNKPNSIIKMNRLKD
ncbi:winged helix-turn-helix domain-containing protein [Pseudoalteromonas sp. NBT06-2]|uniref:winged helix-turn-helix domain-containing protein n=1 Tax=Pseudoalteromonas sp. NBT06-2 TaxID=2025950 RepID=UPI00148253BC|nr:winged helix-turn-helix domain-containing protein [Pseudoalteromonas sp. NBT06-2]